MCPNLNDAKALARDAELKADTELGRLVPGARWLRVRSLLTLALLIAVVLAWWRWTVTPPAPPGGASNLPPVATVGGAAAYKPEAVKGSTPRLTAPSRIRPRTTPPGSLPPKEQPHVPVWTPPAGWTDNMAGGSYQHPGGQLSTSPELADTALVPHSGGDTEVRTYLLPSGEFQTTLTPLKEPFWGVTPRRVALGVGIGVGGQQAAARARWQPLRVGNVTVSGEGIVYAEPDGRLKGSAMGWVEYNFGR